MRTYQSIPVEDRLWDKIEKTETCWVWTASKDTRGYAKIGGWKKNGKYGPITVSRVMWEMFNDAEIPEGMCVLHRCDNPSCVNPEHLFLGTNKDNTHDCMQKGRFIMGEGHPNSKLTEEQVLEIRASTETQWRIAEKYGVGQMCVSRIKNNLRWKQLP